MYISNKKFLIYENFGELSDYKALNVKCRILLGKKFFDLKIKIQITKSHKFNFKYKNQQW